MQKIGNTLEHSFANCAARFLHSLKFQTDADVCSYDTSIQTEWLLWVAWWWWSGLDLRTRVQIVVDVCLFITLIMLILNSFLMQTHINKN